MPNAVLNFDELNILTRDQIRDKVEAEIYSELPEKKVDRKRCEDIIFDLLTMAYAYGLNKAGLELDQSLPVNDGLMRESVYGETAGETAFERMTAHIDAASPGIESGGPTAVDSATKLIDQLTVLIDTEQHRVANEGILDGANDYQRQHPERIVMKTWQTMLDDRVREPHEWLEGATVPLDAYFYTDGDRALAPGGFQSAALNVNCRCELDVSAI